MLAQSLCILTGVQQAHTWRMSHSCSMSESPGNRGSPVAISTSMHPAVVASQRTFQMRCSLTHSSSSSSWLLPQEAGCRAGPQQWPRSVFHCTRCAHLTRVWGAHPLQRI